MGKSQADIRRSVTEQILRTLKDGQLPPWRKNWCDDANAPGLHTSLSTGNPYRGVNQLILQMAAMRFGYRSKWWGTYRQIQQNNAHVRRGQKGVHVVLWKPIRRQRVNETGTEITDSFFIMREFCVFSVEQAENLPQFQVGFSQSKDSPAKRYEKAEEIIANTNARIEFGGNLPCFRPLDDLIQMPYSSQFDSPENYYETLFHELVHWCDHKDRGVCKQGQEYAFAELVAEIGACFLMDELGLPTGATFSNSAAYVQGWLTSMANDHRYIFAASKQASKCADLILSFSRSSAETSETTLAA